MSPLQPPKPEALDWPEMPTCVAVAGDWHGSGSFACDLIKLLPASVDVVIQVGDFGFQFNDDYLHRVNKAARDARPDRVIHPGQS